MTTMICLGGNELSNHCRTLTYIANGLPGHNLFDIKCNLPDVAGHFGQCSCTLEPGESYSNPATDDAPWYDPSVPASAEFFGALMAEDFEIGSSYGRTTAESDHGGRHSRRSRRPREIRVQMWLVASTERGTWYGKKWLQQALAGSDNCNGDALSWYAWCDPDSEALSKRYLFDVALTGEGVTDTSPPEMALSQGARVEFTLTAANPAIYSEPVVQCDNLSAAAQPVIANDLSDCGGSGLETRSRFDLVPLPTHDIDVRLDSDGQPWWCFVDGSLQVQYEQGTLSLDDVNLNLNEVTHTGVCPDKLLFDLRQPNAAVNLWDIEAVNYLNIDDDPCAEYGVRYIFTDDGAGGFTRSGPPSGEQCVRAFINPTNQVSISTNVALNNSLPLGDIGMTLDIEHYGAVIQTTGLPDPDSPCFPRTGRAEICAEDRRMFANADGSVSASWPVDQGEDLPGIHTYTLTNAGARTKIEETSIVVRLPPSHVACGSDLIDFSEPIQVENYGIDPFWTAPVNVQRVCCEVPEPTWWADGAEMKLELVNQGSSPVRNARIRVWSDPGNLLTTPETDFDEWRCRHACGDYLVREVPPVSTLTIDAVQRERLLACNGGFSDAAPLVVPPSGQAWDWVWYDGGPLWVCLEVDPDNTNAELFLRVTTSEREDR